MRPPTLHYWRSVLWGAWRAAAWVGIATILSVTSVWHVWLIEHREDGFHIVQLPAVYATAQACRVRSTSINNDASWPVSACRRVLY
jgi:hypothetical protein